MLLFVWAFASMVMKSDFAFFYSTCLRAGGRLSGHDGIRGPGPNLEFELAAPGQKRVLPVPNQSSLPSISANHREEFPVRLAPYSVPCRIIDHAVRALRLAQATVATGSVFRATNCAVPGNLLPLSRNLRHSRANAESVRFSVYESN